MESRVQPHSQAHERDEDKISAAKSLTPYLFLCALVLAGIIPFASRGVYMDEPQYLHVARAAIQNHWSFPQDASWLFFGKRYANLSSQTHLPVVEYFLAGLIKLIGRVDVIRLRLLFSVFPLLAVLSFYPLARRFTANPLLLSCLFALSPAFFVLSPTLMMDIPMLAFLLAGVSLYLEGLDRPARLWPASICFILAAGTGYTVLVPLGCLLVWAVFNKRPLREWIAIAAAPAAILIWLSVMTLHFGESPATYLVTYYTSHFSLSRTLLPMFSFIGGTAAFPWLYWSLIGSFHRRVIALLSTLAAFLLTFFWVSPSLSYRLWFVFLASSGIALLVTFCVKAAQNVAKPAAAGYGFLLLWLPATLMFLLLFAEMISARYILLSLPPLLLVVFDRIHRRHAAYVVAATAILSVALAIGDYRFVNSYPNWVAQNISGLQEQGFRIWNATESGLRFYVEAKGIETLDSADIRPRGGDLIMRQTSFRYGMANELESLLVSVFETDLVDAYPIRTFSRDAGAGFHDSHFGFVPFSISRAPLDHLAIAEVSPFVIDLPQVVPEDYSSVPTWFPRGVVLKQVEPEMLFNVRFPRDTSVKYELEGRGTVSLSKDSIVLKKEDSGPVLWKNFRIVSNAWPHLNP